MPLPGAHELRIITPTLLELTLISTKEPDPAPVQQWNFVNDSGAAQLPDIKQIKVVVAAHEASIEKIGFKRRVLYAPLKKRDLRVANWLYLELAKPIGQGAIVEVSNPSGTLWATNMFWRAKADPWRWSPAIHVNQVGYLPASPKHAMVGYYLGNLGELSLSKAAEGADANNGVGFKLIAASTHKVVHEGKLHLRAEKGFNFPTYQQVWEADFSSFSTPGEYVLQVAGLGVSFPFLIDEGIGACFARSVALGLYHQRCGTSNVLPLTRFTHGPCHTAPAEVPNLTFTNAQFFIAQSSSDATNNPRHVAPVFKNSEASLYPFHRHGLIDVSGGHHDAGDYSKYTINSAGLIHYLVFGADNFSGAGELDNLGLPESGDGKSDLLQEAKWEADFLAKMQDEDGGFYFLVYPRNRRYENNVKPDKGDPQIVWPKNTAATAAAIAALAQCGSSPRFKKQFPAETARYLEAAVKGWAFLDKAIQKYGKDGAYQKLTHYGNEFMHDDELAWAATELFVATGEDKYHKRVLEWLNPSNPKTKKWGWWRLYEGYGRGIRSYAFAVKSGRRKQNDLDLPLLTKCENEIIAGATEQMHRAEESAYGISFPSETKRTRSAGWFFASEAEFDLAVAMQLDFPSKNDPRPKFLEAMLSNFNFETGCNPVNMTYITGLGWKRQHEIVSQYEQNDWRRLPPSGLPIGNIQGGFGWLDRYQKELGALSFPLDGDQENPYPFYDRWGDSFNLSTEFVILNQGRSVAAAAFLLAKTSLKEQAWKSSSAQIVFAQPSSDAGRPVPATLQIDDPDLKIEKAQIVWEHQNEQPLFGTNFLLSPATQSGLLEAEACWPDGRRVFASTNLSARSGIKP
ncbi:MAG TPA: glycoside hydrolase family 9 protein [Verrucomicrobiae bacterium]